MRSSRNECFDFIVEKCEFFFEKKKKGKFERGVFLIFGEVFGK